MCQYGYTYHPDGLIHENSQTMLEAAESDTANTRLTRINVALVGLDPTTFGL